MKTLKNKYIPIEGFRCINLFGTIFYRNGKMLTDIDINHETVHDEQARDLFPFKPIGYIIFYILYGLEWFIKMLICLFVNRRPYYSISFEQEAWNNEYNLNYTNYRRRFSWVKYIFKLV